MSNEFSGTVAGSDPSSAWLFAEAVLGNDISITHGVETDAPRAQADSGWLAEVSIRQGRQLRALAVAEAESRRKQNLLEWVSQILNVEEDWDPDKHPRGDFPENRGWLSPTWRSRLAH